MTGNTLLNSSFEIHTKVDKLAVLARKIVKYKSASASSNNKVLKMPL